MAVLGNQIVITLVFVSVLSKLISPLMSLGRYLLTRTGLVRYVPPSDEELKMLAPVPPKWGRAKSRGNHKDLINSADSFNVPRSIDVQLEKSPVTLIDVVQLRFYNEYEWLVDFCFGTCLLYATTELYIFYFPNKAVNEVNLSMLWCLLLGGFAYKILVTIASTYFQADDSYGERSLVIVMGIVYLLLAMLVLIVEEDTLESGLDVAYASFNKSAALFLADNTGLDSSGPASKLMLKLCLAVWCGSIGALFTFPGLRLAKMHWDVLEHSQGRSALTVCLHLSFIMPLMLTTLWIRPLSREYLTEKTFKGMTDPFMTPRQFETMRIYLVLFVILFRLAVMSSYLQSYLNVAFYKIEELKQEAGKISNIELRKTVARVFYYLCVVTLQYVAPMCLILAITMMYKTMGGAEWTGFWTEATAQDSDPVSSNSNSSDDNDPLSSLNVPEHFSLAWQSFKQVFQPAVFKGLLGFSLWWCCLTWFTSAAIGITYHSHFAKS